MINNIKYINYNKDNQCMIRYHTDIRGYKEYWYKDLESLLQNYEFIIIDSFVFPMYNGKNIGVDFLKEFCDIMTIGNKVVICDTEEFVKYLNSMNSNIYYDTCINILDNILYTAGFEAINTYGYSYNYKDVYVYINSRIGLQVYNEIENYYGLVEDDLFWSE